jgi:hypothetical protein
MMNIGEPLFLTRHPRGWAVLLHARVGTSEGKLVLVSLNAQSRAGSGG